MFSSTPNQPLVCEVLRRLGKETVLVIDHDPSVQGEFDCILDLVRDPQDGRLLITHDSEQVEDHNADSTDQQVASLAL